MAATDRSFTRLPALISEGPFPKAASLHLGGGGSSHFKAPQSPLPSHRVQAEMTLRTAVFKAKGKAELGPGGSPSLISTLYLA